MNSLKTDVISLRLSFLKFT